jgi:chemotaxis protein MotA
MDPATGLGVIFGFGMLLTGYIIEAGSLPALLALSPIFIVFGGTLGAITAQYTLKEILNLPRYIMDSMTMPKGNNAALTQLIETLVTLAEKARREGVLSLESDIQGELSDKKYDPMLKKGLRLMVDGSEPELIKHMLENEITIYEDQKKREASIFVAAGGYSPTMGIIGTVMGLIKVLGSLTDPSQLAPAVAMAFIATLYGVSFANLFWLPLGGKLAGKLKQEVLQKELTIEGIMSIQAGENPRILREKLEVFLLEKKNNN